MRVTKGRGTACVMRKFYLGGLGDDAGRSWTEAYTQVLFTQSSKRFPFLLQFYYSKCQLKILLYRLTYSFQVLSITLSRHIQDQGACTTYTAIVTLTKVTGCKLKSGIFDF
jgi:hypothetical protein